MHIPLASHQFSLKQVSMATTLLHSEFETMFLLLVVPNTVSNWSIFLASIIDILQTSVSLSSPNVKCNAKFKRNMHNCDYALFLALDK
jgi:hypothetical protein